MALFDCPRGATERSREEREKKRFVQRELIFLNSLLARKGKKRGKTKGFWKRPLAFPYRSISFLLLLLRGCLPWIFPRHSGQ